MYQFPANRSHVIGSHHFFTALNAFLNFSLFKFICVNRYDLVLMRIHFLSPQIARRGPATTVSARTELGRQTNNLRIRNRCGTTV